MRWRFFNGLNLLASLSWFGKLHEDVGNIIFQHLVVWRALTGLPADKARLRAEPILGQERAGRRASNQPGVVKIPCLQANSKR